MTKRSSFVIPPVRADVAVIVDIVIAPPKFIDATLADEPGRIKLWASQQGNIPVKPAPIRLLALCTAVRPLALDPAPVSKGVGSCPSGRVYCSAQAGGLTAFKRDRIARLHAAARRETKRLRAYRWPLARNE